LRAPLLVALFSLQALAGEAVQVQVLSAVVKDQRIDGAEVIVQKNGAQSVSVTTHADGMAAVTPAFPDTDDGVLLIIKKAGYSPLVTKCPCKGMTYALSPVMHSLDGLRVVLTWGTTPADLDLHTVFPGNHVFFSHKLGRDANLDVDDTDGSGPETITIEKKAFGQPYLFAVHDYTNRETTQRAALAESRARVFVYVGETLIRRYEVPTHGLGTLWTVFSIDEQGEFHDINTLLPTRPDPEPVLVSALQLQSPVATTAVSAAVTGDATGINAEGERAYHAGRVDESIDLYRRAIELSPDYGQAWSNLGLSYRKRGRVAEALWATRKAISLASGPDANVVRASSYYNVARIYEDEGQFADAQVQYELAAKERPIKVYADSIRRVQAKQRN
jgi:hypothetical protein